MPILPRVLRGLGRSFGKIGALLALIILIAAIALIVAIPRWYFSSTFAAGSTIFVFSLLAAVLIAALSRRVVALSRDPGALLVYLNRSVLPILLKIAVVIASVAVLYGIAILLSRGHILLSIISILLWVLLLGLFRYGRRTTR